MFFFISLLHLSINPISTKPNPTSNPNKLNTNQLKINQVKSIHNPQLPHTSQQSNLNTPTTQAHHHQKSIENEGIKNQPTPPLPSNPTVCFSWNPSHHNTPPSLEFLGITTTKPPLMGVVRREKREKKYLI